MDWGVALREGELRLVHSVPVDHTNPKTSLKGDLFREGERQDLSFTYNGGEEKFTRVFLSHSAHRSS